MWGNMDCKDEDQVKKRISGIATATSKGGVHQKELAHAKRKTSVWIEESRGPGFHFLSSEIIVTNYYAMLGADHKVPKLRLWSENAQPLLGSGAGLRKPSMISLPSVTHERGINDAVV